MVNISDNDDVMDVSCAGSDNSDNLMDTSDGLFQHEQNFEKNINISDDVVDKNDELLNIVIPPPPEPCMRDDGSGERLVISSIDVENFKSYYGRQTIGPLHKVSYKNNITIIIFIIY